MGGLKIASHNVYLRVDEIKYTNSSPHSWHWKARPLSFPFEVTTLAVRTSWVTDQLNQGGRLKRGFECELQDVSSQREIKKKKDIVGKRYCNFFTVNQSVLMKEGTLKQNSDRKKKIKRQFEYCSIDRYPVLMAVPQRSGP